MQMSFQIQLRHMGNGMNHLLQDYVHASETETKKQRQAEQEFRD